MTPSTAIPTREPKPLRDAIDSGRLLLENFCERPIECDVCHGDGYVEGMSTVFLHHVSPPWRDYACSECEGTGRYYALICKRCNGVNDCECDYETEEGNGR